MYRAVKTFRDRDTRILYRPGDVYPRSGTYARKYRLEELLTSQNRRAEPMIEYVPDAPDASAAVAVKKPRQSRKKAEPVKVSE